MPENPKCSPALDARVQELHRLACERGESFYHDPDTGLRVTTELEHLQRGKCCRSGCRHCPYGFRLVLPK